MGNLGNRSLSDSAAGRRLRRHTRRARFPPVTIRWSSETNLREDFMASAHLLAMFAPSIALPDANATFLMLLRWIHFLAGITWIGLLYFFNLVNVPFMKELDTATKGKIMPGLMLRALWWFRWAAVVTVLMGFIYWAFIIVPGDPAGNTHHVVVVWLLVSFLAWCA